MHTIGTAGHVDHGKSALVLSLTGHNPDRLIEEQRRGMTLDLGFAPLVYDDGVRAGIIDVPGHERFLHNMLAGAAGMELLLLVVAATEGPREQTREHLQVLGFLNVKRTLVVLTKSDLVDEAGRDAALALTRQAAEGTVAEGAPAYFVSNVTGEGIADLRAAIHDALAELPQRSPQAPAYLPIDRVFSIAGHGTVVTGTLMQGTIAAGDALRLQPSGRDVKVRGLHVFGEPKTRVHGGTRAAVNLGGVDAAEIARGETLAAPREFAPSRDIAITFTPLASALTMLRRRTPVRAHIGSAEIPGSLIFDPRPPAGAHTVRARLVLHTPVAVASGTRLVLRRMSPKDLIGGGVAEPLEFGRSDESQTEDASAPLAALIARLLADAGAHSLSAARIAAALNARVEEVETALDGLLRGQRVVELKKPQEYMAAATAAETFDRVLSVLRARHEITPWIAGSTSDAIAKAVALPEPLLTRMLLHWFARGEIARAGRYWSAPQFRMTLTQEQSGALDSALRAADPNPLVPVAIGTLNNAIRTANVRGLADAVDGMFATGALVRIGDDVYRQSQVDAARKILVQLLRTSGAATLASVRTAFGTSRRYALPLTEYFDGIGLTARDGDLRRLRGTAPAE